MDPDTRRSIFWISVTNLGAGSGAFQTGVRESFSCSYVRRSNDIWSKCRWKRLEHGRDYNLNGLCDHASNRSACAEEADICRPCVSLVYNVGESILKLCDIQQNNNSYPTQINTSISDVNKLVASCQIPGFRSARAHRIRSDTCVVLTITTIRQFLIIYRTPAVKSRDKSFYILF